MPRFTKKEDELENHFDRWLYFLKHLESFEAIPGILKEDAFLKGFEIAEIANFNEKELAEYEESLKYYRDLKGERNQVMNGEKKQVMKKDPRAHAIIGSAMEFHRIIGPGHPEAVYHECLEIEFRKGIFLLSRSRNWRFIIKKRS